MAGCPLCWKLHKVLYSSMYTPHQLFWLFCFLRTSSKISMRLDCNCVSVCRKWAVYLCMYKQYSIHTAILPCLFTYVICIFLVDSEVNCLSLSVPHREEFHCSFPDRPSSVRCSFDGGVQEPCSFPLVVESERFSTDSHTVVVTVTNGTGGSQELSFDFRLENREIYI